MRLGWDMAWDLFWFRTFALCHESWFYWVYKMTAPTRQYPANDNRRLS